VLWLGWLQKGGGDEGGLLPFGLADDEDVEEFGIGHCGIEEGHPAHVAVVLFDRVESLRADPAEGFAVGEGEEGLVPYRRTSVGFIAGWR